MTIFKCRSVKPAKSKWFDIEANDFGDAIQSIHSRYVPNIADNLGVHMANENKIHSVCYRKRDNDEVEGVYFSLIEVEGVGEFVSRIYYKCIRRIGKFKRDEITLDDVAKILGWQHPAEQLLNDGWEAESNNYTDCNGKVVA